MKSGAKKKNIAKNLVLAACEKITVLKSHENNISATCESAVIANSYSYMKEMPHLRIALPWQLVFSREFAHKTDEVRER